MRGIRALAACHNLSWRIIPAHAGNTGAGTLNDEL